MIKLIAAVLIAVVAVGHVSADEKSEAEQEVSLLLGDEKVFGDFCITARKSITDDIKSRVDKQASKVYQLFFNSFVVEIADEVLNVAREDIAKFTETIATPPSLESAPAGPISERELQQRVEDSVEAIEEKIDGSTLGRLSAASSGVVQTMFKTMKSAFFVRLAKTRSVMTKENFLQGFVDSCHQVARYEKALIENLESAKLELLKNAKGDSKMEELIENMDIKELPCETTRYISRLDGACRVLIGGTNWFLKMLGVDSKVDFPQPSQLIEEAPAN